MCHWGKNMRWIKMTPPPDPPVIEQKSNLAHMNASWMPVTLFAQMPPLEPIGNFARGDVGEERRGMVWWGAMHRKFFFGRYGVPVWFVRAGLPCHAMATSWRTNWCRSGPGHGTTVPHVNVCQKMWQCLNSANLTTFVIDPSSVMMYHGSW